MNTKPDKKAETKKRIGELKSELERLEWKVRPPVPRAAWLLAVDDERRRQIASILEEDLEFYEAGEFHIRLGAGKNAAGGMVSGKDVAFRFGQPAVFVSVAASIPLDEAKKVLLEAAASLETKWAELHEEAEHKTSDFGREYEDMAGAMFGPVQEEEDVPF